MSITFIFNMFAKNVYFLFDKIKVIKFFIYKIYFSIHKSSLFIYFSIDRQVVYCYKYGMILCWHIFIYGYIKFNVQIYDF